MKSYTQTGIDKIDVGDPDVISSKSYPGLT